MKKSILALCFLTGLLVGCGEKSSPSTTDAKPAAQAPAPSTPAAQPEAQPAAVSAAPAQADPGEAFLAENAKKDGVKTTASGLQYKVIKSGTGDAVKATDSVKVHYHGTLIDGTVFDSSVQRGEPITFPVTAVIPGWVEALQMMKVGDKWQLFIPARLAYGPNSPTPAIPPNSVLIFEVEILAIDNSNTGRS
jgi:FKBP-type peptidyl-prolyl cis-trans isomerase FklB